MKLYLRLFSYSLPSIGRSVVAECHLKNFRATCWNVNLLLNMREPEQKIEIFTNHKRAKNSLFYSSK